MITNSQKKKLKAAGYTVSGNTVKNKDGGSIGGINENGKIWSGSSKVTSILKSGEDKKSEPKKKTTPKSTTSKKKPSTPSSSLRPKQRQKGRGDGKAETTRRKSDNTSGLSMTPRVTSGQKVKNPQDTKKAGSLRVTPAPSSFSSRREKAKQITSAGPEQGPKPTLQQFINDGLRKLNVTGAERVEATKKLREEYKRKFNKGGMVSYKDKGMFYKSASPRGYK